jgi:hypothetical protein
MKPEQPPDESIIPASEVWLRLTEGQRRRVTDLLVRIAYKCVTANTTVAADEAAECSPANDDSPVNLKSREGKS